MSEGFLFTCLHRWLLLSFKREFPFEDGIHLFEILSSHHLELCSLEAEKAKRREQVLEKERMGKEKKVSWQYVLTNIHPGGWKWAIEVYENTLNREEEELMEGT